MGISRGDSSKIENILWLCKKKLDIYLDLSNTGGSSLQNMCSSHRDHNFTRKLERKWVKSRPSKLDRFLKPPQAPRTAVLFHIPMLIHRVVSWNSGTPKWSIYRWIFHDKPTIFGYPHLWKSPWNVSRLLRWFYPVVAVYTHPGSSLSWFHQDLPVLLTSPDVKISPGWCPQMSHMSSGC